MKTQDSKVHAGASTSNASSKSEKKEEISLHSLKDLEKAFQKDLEAARSLEDLKNLRVRYLGKRSELRSFLHALGRIKASERKEFGQKSNVLKESIQEGLLKKETRLQGVHGGGDSDGRDDISLSGRMPSIGSQHPLSLVRNEVLGFFNRRGFITVWGNEAENEYYNFEALNIPEQHPARDDHDSFYVKGYTSLLLRSQTSNMQIRVGEQNAPPLAIVSPGRVFRRDTLDASHSYTFHQIEGMYVNKAVSFADLKGLLIAFCKEIFGQAVKVRFRPDYFPFTEPSCEISIEYAGKNNAWLEVLGAGLMNPIVLRNMGIDTDIYSGYAFGLGLERIAMLRYGIRDIRLFYENDEDFLDQFRQ